MAPSLALLLWFILLVALLRFDPAKDSKTSIALWVPVIWMFIVGSRLPSQWFGGLVAPVAEILEEGNPFDRTVSSTLILLAVIILVSRSFKWRGFFQRNVALVLFLSFALVSFVWSDFPMIALKRWFRDLGNYLMVLVVLSDPRPLEAVRTTLRRLGFLLIPLSIVLVKYYPVIGRQYDYWKGTAETVGVTTSKNMLGVACLVSGIFFFWDAVTRWPERKRPGTKRIMAIDVAFLAMTIWLLNLANSATSSVCLVMGCLVIAAACSKTFYRRPGLLKALIPTCFGLYLVLAFGFNVNGELAGAVGRDPTLTDRTKIWELLLGMHTNPVVGTGYESFWLGPRLQTVWHGGFGTINEAHNGYLSIYLNLGLIGVLLLVGFLISSYQTICKGLKPQSSLAFLALGVWAVLVLYNMTEAAFPGGLLWMTLLMGSLALPARAVRRIPSVARFDNAEAVEQVPFEATAVQAVR